MRPAGREDRQPRRRRQQLGRERRRLEQMLEVVEHQEQLAVGEERLERVLDRLAAALVERRAPAAIACGSSSGSATAASGTKRAPSANSPATARATSSASRVLPVPPAPVSVSRRTPGRTTSARTCSSSRRRPTNDVSDAGQLGPAAVPREIERGIVREDPPLQLAELLARLEPELLDERRPRVAIRRERLGLPARAIQRQHQLTREALAQRVRPDRRCELPDERRRAGRRRARARTALPWRTGAAPRAARSRSGRSPRTRGRRARGPRQSASASAWRSCASSSRKRCRSSSSGATRST